MNPRKLTAYLILVALLSPYSAPLAFAEENNGDGSVSPGPGGQPIPGPGGGGDDNDRGRPGRGERPCQPNDPRPRCSPENPQPPQPNPEPQPPRPQPPQSDPEPQPDTLAAYQQGLTEGTESGRRDGAIKGAQEGQVNGEAEGRSQGFRVCENEEKERSYNLGYNRAYREGERQGEIEGTSRGKAEGYEKGRNEGYAAGVNQAENDAASNAEGPGRQSGLREADGSDAVERGRIDGIAAGEQQARETSLRVDYPKGRDDLRRDRFNEAIESQENFSQRPQVRPAKTAGLLKSIVSSLAQVKSVLSSSENPFTNPQERAAYERGQREGYSAGYNQGYSQVYQRAFNGSRESSYRIGCQDARARDYREDARRGAREGRAEGYQRGFDRTYAENHRLEYSRAFGQAQSEGYNQTYDVAYKQVYERARSEAFQERRGQLYSGSFNVSKQQRFNQLYPGLAKQQYQRGRMDEEADFRVRPVRLIGAEVTESNSNGLLEPGETLRVKLQLRNFDTSAVQGKSVQIKVTSLSEGLVNIGKGEELLAGNLNKRSLTTVSDALEFQLLETAVNRRVSIKVAVIKDGKLAGEQVIDLSAKFLVGVGFAESPTLQEGIATTLKFKLLNQSPNASAQALKVRLASDNRGAVEILSSQASVESIGSGKEQVIEFTVIARQGGDSISLPISVEVTQGEQRVGLLEVRPSVPLVNDYKISSKSIAKLRASGVTKVEYKIENVSSRSATKSLQLAVRIMGPNSSNFNVIGPNPQLLRPLRSGREASFVVPINAKTTNSGGVLELEVRESGRVVVISRISF